MEVAHTLGFEPPLDLQSNWAVIYIFLQVLSSLGPLLSLPEEPEVSITNEYFP